MEVMMMDMDADEEMLKQIWNNHAESPSWDKAFYVEDLLPFLIIKANLTPEETVAMLEYWRTKMVTYIDWTVQRCKWSISRT
jgi:hypothetical protein